MAATTTVPYAYLNNSQCEISYTYDNHTLPIESVIVANSGASGSVIASIYDLSPYALIWGPETVDFGQGTVTYDVSSAGYSVTMVTDPKNGLQYPSLPVALNVAWHS